MDIQKLSRDIEDVLELKRTHPYVRTEWISSGTLAKKSIDLLRRIAEQVHQLIVDEKILSPSHELRFRVGTGMGYFPRSPWITFLVDDAKPSKGIFPVVGFDDRGRGFLIGCADSVAAPQLGFSDFCYTPDELSHPEKIDNSDVIPYSEHLAKGAVWFAAGEDLSVSRMVSALRTAFDVLEKINARNSEGKQHETWYDEVPVVDCCKWLEFLNHLSGKQDVSRRHWVFRGQGDSGWQLNSSLERTIDYRDLTSIAKAKENEKWSLQWFRRISSQKLGYRQIADLDLLSLLQHYGGKTRLLDFSFSPLVALYMAVEQWDGIVNRGARNPDNEQQSPDFSVWALDFREIDDFDEVDEKRGDHAFREAINGGLFDIVERQSNRAFAVIPKVMNTRLAAQEGLFVMSSNLATPLEATLQKILTNKSVLRRPIKSIWSDTMLDAGFSPASAYKFVFSGDTIEKAKALLAHLCITPRMIYPDLSGMAKDACLCF